MSKKSTPVLERIARNLGSLFVVVFALAAVALAANTWVPGGPPQAAPGTGNVALPAEPWQVNGSNIYRTTGNVGIGTAAPSGKLDVIGSILVRNSTSVPTMNFYGGALSNALYGIVGAQSTSSAGIFIGLSAVDDRITVFSNGNVGIGTTTAPLQKLGVGGNIGTPDILIGGSSIEVGTYVAGNKYSYIDFRGDDTYTDYGLRLIRNNTGADTSSLLVHRGTGSLSLVALDAGSVTLKTNNLTRLIVSPTTGNVGIGTGTPSTKLEVVGGAIKATGGLIIETRTSDPASPVTGQIWLRTDI